MFLTGPMFVNTDISIIKAIPIHEQIRFNIYAEMINAFNHTNWNVTDNFSGSTNNPAQYVNVTSSTYTAASIANPGNGAGGARSIQFRLQLMF
jgi:hypothetical protein